MSQGIHEPARIMQIYAMACLGLGKQWQITNNLTNLDYSEKM
ncbi:hypothetical protein [Coleofasciculus sp. G2-EDA-02]